MRSSTLIIIIYSLCWSFSSAGEANSLAKLSPEARSTIEAGLSREAQLLLDEMAGNDSTWGALAEKLEQEIRKNPDGKKLKIYVAASLANQPIRKHRRRFAPDKIGGPLGNYPFYMFLHQLTQDKPVTVRYTEDHLVLFEPKKE